MSAISALAVREGHLECTLIYHAKCLQLSTELFIFATLNSIPTTMNRLRTLLLLTIVCTFTTRLYAGLHFVHIDTHGHTVFCICRDADGVAWAGTSNGLTTLAQLQGAYPFSYIRHEALNDQIASIEKDMTGRLWLLTHSNRMLVYDPHRNHVITDVPAYLKQLGMPYGNERLIVIGPQERLWSSDGKIVCCYDFKTKSKKCVTLPSNIGTILSLQHDGNDIFVITASQIYGITTKQNRVEYLGKTPMPLTSNRIILVRDKDHNLWLATDNRLFRLEKGSNQWTDLRDVHHVKGIVTTKTGKTIVATTNYGLYIFSPGSSQPTCLRQTPPNTDGLLTNHLESLYYSEELNAVVIGYNKGNLSVVTQRNEKYAIFSLASAASQFNPVDAMSFAASPDGHSFWAGTEDGGIYRVDDTGDAAVQENRYQGKTVTALFTDSQQHLWTGIYNEGILAGDGRWFFRDQSPYAIVQPKPRGRIFAALLGQGIHAIDPFTGTTQRVETDNPWIIDLAAGNGRLYAVSNQFIYDIDPVTLKAKKIPTTILGPKNRMMEGHRDIYANSRGWLWMVSNVNHSPLYVYETSTGKTHTLNSMEKFVVVSISADNNGNIWCTTDQGLVRITTDGEKFTINKYLFNIRHDFRYNPRALYALPDGNMVAGTSLGIIRFNPRQLSEEPQKDSRPQEPIITTLRINGLIQSPASIGENTPSSSISDIIYTRQLDLAHEDKNIFIECRPRDFMPEIAEQYYYQLKGYSDDWLPTSNNSITLSNLQPGHYDLLLRTALPDDPTSEEFHMLHIRIRQPFWLTPWGIALWASLAAITGTILFFFIRNRHNYRQQLRRIARQKQQEAELNEMKTRFFTNVSHDLRTPLTLIIAPVDQLIKRFTEHPSNDDTLKQLDTVKRNANRLLSLTNQILDMREAELNYDTLQKTPTDIGKLLGNLAATFLALAEKRNISFSVKMPEEQHILQIDSEKIYKIVSNLVSNSFKFTPDGGSITLDCAILPTDEGATMTLRVADTGMGISEKDLPHIFERFYYSKQLHSSHKSSGIGLNIVKQYTELMDGTVSVERNTPRGTVFTLDIPVDELNQQTGQQEDRQEDGKKDNRPTILIADDNTELLSFIANSLNEEYNIVAVTNGEEALRVLADEQQTVDVVVSDIMMPGIDGMELTRRIKEDVNLSHIPVILLTAKALEEDQLKGLQMGANDYITKPFNADILRLRIRAWMQRRQVARERFSEVPEVEPEKLTITTLDEQLLQRAVSTVSEHMHEPDFNVDQLASLIGIHRTGLNRKLQFITGQTPIVFIRTLRLKRARQLMEADPQLPVSQVAYQVGFNNPKIFSRYFAEEFGCKPSEYIRKQKEEG